MLFFMKKINILKITIAFAFYFFLLLFNFAQVLMEDKYINDYAKILTETDKKTIRDLLFKFENKKNIEISIFIINSINEHFIENNLNYDEFIKKLFDAGKYKNKNNAVLLFIALKDKRLQFECGADIDEKFQNLIQNIIENKIVPNFKEGEYSRGIYDGVREIIKKNEIKKTFFEFKYFLWIIISLIIGLILTILIKNTGKKTKKNVDSFGVGVYGNW